MFSNTLSFLSSHNVSDQVSHPYKTTGQIIFLRTNSSENYSHSVKYCIFYYPEQQIHNIYIYIYINNISYIISTPTCFYASSSSSGSLDLVLCSEVTKLLKL
jgi:hypothetical protein